MHTIDASEARTLKRAIFAEMLRTRGAKYGWWLKSIAGVKFVARTMSHENGVRAEITEILYAALHLVDDYVDGDVALPQNCESGSEYIRRVLDFIRKGNAPTDAVEWLLAYAFDLASGVGEDLSVEVKEIVLSMLFDADRRSSQTLRIVTEAELQEHFHRLDIVGTIGACVKLMKERLITVQDLVSLGEASRIYYTLRDVPEDICARLCNIPAEDIDRFGLHDLFELPIGDLEYVRVWTRAERVQAWVRKEAQRGLQELRKYRDNKPRLNIGWLTRLVLYFMFELPAQRYLAGI